MALFSAPMRGLLGLGRIKIPFSQHRFLSEETVSKFKHLKLEVVKPFVINVQLNRLDKRNALNSVLWSEIGEVCKVLSDDPDCRVVIFSGNGKLFSSGIDLNDLTKISSVITSEEDVARKARKMHGLIKSYQNSFLEIEKCSKPVIMAVHGACVGGATSMVCFGDVRLCTQDAYFQIKETILGFAADVGALQLIPKILNNQSTARELVFTGRTLSSEEAEKLGFVSNVFKDKDLMMTAAISMAETMANLSPVAVQGSKLNLNYSRDHSLEDSLDFMAIWNMGMLQSEDVLKAAMSLLSKSDQPPSFSKL